MCECLSGTQWLQARHVLTTDEVVTQKTARQVSELMVSMGADLDRSMSLVKETESDADFKRYRESISKIMTVMLLEIMNPLYVEHPDLKPEQLR